MIEFYIDVDKAIRLGITKRVSVSLNGRKIRNAIAAKSGKFGFVEYYDKNMKVASCGNEILTHKKRGNVKVSISHDLG